jgi:hypothetical protein
MPVRFLFLILLFTVIGIEGSHSQNTPPQGSDGILQTFHGRASQTTPPFSVTADHWEVRWTAQWKLNVSVVAADGSVVAGATTPFAGGALYVAKGGTYHLQIDSAAPPMPPQNNSNNNGGSTGLENTINGGNDNSPSNQNSNPPQDPQAIRMEQFANGRWEVEVVDMNSATAKNTSSMFGFGGGMPNYVLPATTVAGAGVDSSTPDAPAASATPPIPAGKMTEDQARAVVLITGDNAEGTGFMIKTPDGPAVVTNIHVIANNPNLKITTNTGALVTVLSEKGASDRDLAMLAIKDDGYSYLDVDTNISQTVQPGDEVITPGNSQGGEVMLNTSGKVLGIGPERIEFDNPIYHGNSGGPVFHTKSGKVLGVVTEAIKVDVSNDLDKASFASRNSAISGSMRYFGLRLDTVSAWIPIDSRTFQIETAFLDQFHQQSERLDSYLNSSDNNNNQSEDSNGGDSSSNSVDAKLYLSDEKIMKANNSYVEQASGSDTSQKIDSLRDLLFDLQSIADTNVSQIQNTNNFYSFDRDRARDELAYRKALKDELDSIGNNVDRLGSLPHVSN